MLFGRETGSALFRCYPRRILAGYTAATLHVEELHVGRIDAECQRRLRLVPVKSGREGDDRTAAQFRMQQTGRTQFLREL